MSTSRNLPHDWFPWPLPENVEIGKRSWLYSTFSLVHYRSCRPVGVRIGHDSGLYNGTFFDLGPNGEVSIGNYCTVVGAIFSTNGRITIADYSFIAHEVVIADREMARPFADQERDQPRKQSTVRIGKNVWIGARAVVHGNVEIGDGAIVGAAAIVTDMIIPPYTIFGGNPARQIGVVRRTDSDKHSP